MCLFAVTRTACTHCTACSCLRASGTERDYVVSYSLCCTLVWCVRGLSCSTVSWAHLGNVTGVKSGEPGAYYVTLFLQFGNRRLLARPGLCRTVRRGHNIWFQSRLPCATLPHSPREGPTQTALQNVPDQGSSAGSCEPCKRTSPARCWYSMKAGHLRRKLDEGSAEDRWTVMDVLREPLKLFHADSTRRLASLGRSKPSQTRALAGA